MGLLITNWTQVPNFLLDQVMPVVDSAEWKVLSLICRKTFGWQKLEDRISLTQFEQATNLSRPWLVKVLARFTKSGLLVKTGSTRGNIYRLNLECDVEQVIIALRPGVKPTSLINPINQLTQTTATGSLTLPQLVNPVNTQKPKETNKPKKEPSFSAERDPIDPRHRPICDHIREMHAEANCMNPKLVPWGPAEGAGLKKFLKNYPTLSVKDACRCVDHYYQSDVNISASPRKWIPNLLEYWAGPMNQYKIPRHFDKEYQREEQRRAEANVGVYKGEGVSEDSRPSTSKLFPNMAPGDGK